MKNELKNEKIDLPLEATSGAILSNNRSSTIFLQSISLLLVKFLSSFYLLICSYTHFTASSLLFFSQIPSHPINMKSHSFVRSNSYVSGLAVIAYSSGVRWDLCLYLMSPNALVRFRFPSTLPSVITLPDFSILSIST